MMRFRGHNAGDLDLVGDLFIGGHNSGDIDCDGDVTLNNHNSGDIECTGVVAVNNHNSGDIESKGDVLIGRHNSGTINSESKVTIRQHNSDEILAKIIEYQGLLLTVDKLKKMSQKDTITHKNLTLSRKSNDLWKIEEPNGNVNELRIRGEKLHMLCVGGDDGSTININGTSISISGSGTVIVDGNSVVIRNG